MDITLIRTKLRLTQSEMALLIEIPLSKLKRLESGSSSLPASVERIMEMLENPHSYGDIVCRRCTTVFERIEDVRTLLSIVRKAPFEDIVKGAYEVLIHKQHPQFHNELGWKPE